MHEVSNQDPSFVVSTEEVSLGPFERKLVRAQVVSQQANKYRFCNVMIHPYATKCPFVSEDTLTSVGDVGTVFYSIRNKTATNNVTRSTVIVQKRTIGKAELKTFVFEPIFAEQRGEASALPFEQTNRIRTVVLNNTSSELSSFARNFFSSTEMSEIGLSEN